MTDTEVSPGHQTSTQNKTANQTDDDLDARYDPTPAISKLERMEDTKKAFGSFHSISIAREGGLRQLEPTISFGSSRGAWWSMREGHGPSRLKGELVIKHNVGEPLADVNSSRDSIWSVRVFLYLFKHLSELQRNRYYPSSPRSDGFAWYQTHAPIS